MMSADDLHRLLQAADRDAPPLQPAAGFAGRVAQRVRSRQMRAMRRATTLAAVFVLACVSLFTDGATRRNNTSGPLNHASSAARDLRSELEAIRLERRLTETFVRELLEGRARRQRIAELQREAQRPIEDPLQAIRAQVDQAAHTLVAQANRLENKYGLPDSAVRTYHDVVDLFPSSPWAAVARERLKHLQNPGPRS
jgi:hypothetical protein